ncbi:hypothetical protein E3J62_04590 [candidate division TA06 bacterium]|uniref:TolB N-terminal domain-containing protein n=1 Tax=candidate division TA06 bacterium TaxID=2250710 RepID=A0A523UVL7_UNCT6|nr:MAG: hypothetical protein E3J62_04590 [candidate division TA06 bacterium]
MKKAFLIAAGILLLTQVTVQAKVKMVVLPLRSIGVEETSTQTAYLLLRQEIGKLGKHEVVSDALVRETVDPTPCADVACAADIGRELNAAEVVFGSLNKLGEKIIVQFTLVDVATRKASLIDNITAMSVEDLETVMKRVAKSIVKRQPVAKTAEVGAITEKEALKPRGRRTRRGFATRFGYLFPTNGYDDDEQVFAIDFLTMYEAKDFMVNGLFGIRKGIALNIGATYLSTRTDFCPYFGGGLGFHWVHHNDSEDKRSDGFEAILSGGLIAFRTYNFRILLNLDYCISFNEYNDQALVFTMGMIR